MSLSLTSKSLREIAGREAAGIIVPAAAAGATLGTSLFLRQMRPGGWKTLAGLGCLGGGGYFAVTSPSKTMRALGVGTMAGGIYGLLMKG